MEWGKEKEKGSNYVVVLSGFLVATKEESEG